MQFGSIVKLECLGTVPGPKWLEGSPNGSKVALVATPTTGKKSCLWRVHHDVLNEVDVVLFECISDTVGNHWLDGLTQTNGVQLAPHTHKPFTGTRWRAYPDPQQQPEVFLFECLGHIPGNRWLDGLTQTGQVQLAPTAGGNFTGTRWKVLP